MSNKLSPLSNSTSALLEFRIWSDATSHTTLFTWHASTTGKNWFELVTTSLNDVSLCGMVALYNLHWNPLFSCLMIHIGKTRGLRTMCCLQSKFEPVTQMWFYVGFRDSPGFPWAKCYLVMKKIIQICEGFMTHFTEVWFYIHLRILTISGNVCSSILEVKISESESLQ